MNSVVFRERLNDLRPAYDEKYRDLLDRISQKGDATGRGNVSTFGAFYQTYMYAFLIGLRLGEQRPIERRGMDFAKVGQWKPVPLKDFVLLTLFNRTSAMGYSWNDLETAKPEIIEQFLRAFQKELEGYANRGLEYLQDKFDNEKYIFDDPNVFMNILRDLPTKE